MRMNSTQMSSQDSYLVHGRGEKYESEKENRLKIMLSPTFREINFVIIPLLLVAKAISKLLCSTITDFYTSPRPAPPRSNVLFF